MCYWICRNCLIRTLLNVGLHLLNVGLHLSRLVFVAPLCILFIPVMGPRHVIAIVPSDWCIVDLLLTFNSSKKSFLNQTLTQHIFDSRYCLDPKYKSWHLPNWHFKRGVNNIVLQESFPLVFYFRVCWLPPPSPKQIAAALQYLYSNSDFLKSIFSNDF